MTDLAAEGVVGHVLRVFVVLGRAVGVDRHRVVGAVPVAGAAGPVSQTGADLGLRVEPVGLVCGDPAQIARRRPFTSPVSTIVPPSAMKIS